MPTLPYPLPVPSWGGPTMSDKIAEALRELRAHTEGYEHYGETWTAEDSDEAERELAALLRAEPVGEPTPEKLEAWAEWYERNGLSEELMVPLAHDFDFGAGFLLRLIADEMRHPTKEDHDGR